MKGVITTNNVNCRDCYKCVRACPVKAIRVNEGHAQVVGERCIGDGRCLAVCPQGAKVLQPERARVEAWLATGETVVASLAPSFAGLGGGLAEWGAALAVLGFTRIEETSLGAALVAAATARELAERDRNGVSAPLFTSACPAVVRLIKLYYPELCTFLSPYVSPMIAHGRWLKARLGAKIRVVFVGPCAAKKGEREEAEVEGTVDACLTFAEVMAWLAEKGLYPWRLAPTPFSAEAEKKNEASTWSRARSFPVNGGELWTAGYANGQPVNAYLTISGVEACQDFLANFPELPHPPRVVELLACPGGCLGGPGFPGRCAGVNKNKSVDSSPSFWILRARLLAQAEARREQGPLSWAGGKLQDEPWDLAQIARDLPLRRRYVAAPVPRHGPTEAELRAILARTGKHRPEDELNCGACGYNSCREKAAAVWAGMAEVEMCIPNMRARAEALARLLRDETVRRAQEVIDKQMRVAQEIAGLLGETTAETKTALTKLIRQIRQEGGAESDGGTLFGNREGPAHQDR